MEKGELEIGKTEVWILLEVGFAVEHIFWNCSFLFHLPQLHELYLEKQKCSVKFPVFNINLEIVVALIP